MTQIWNIGQSRQDQLPHPDHADEGHTASVYAIHLRGSYLVSGSADRTIRVWNVDTQRLIRGPLEGHTGSVICLQFDDSPQQDVIISGGADGSVIIWQFSTGHLLQKVENAHAETVLSLVFSDQYLITGGRDTKVKVWNRRALTNPGELPEYLRHSKATSDGTVAAYSQLIELEGQHAAINCVVLHEPYIIAGAGDRTIAIWDLHTGRLVDKIIGLHERGICDLDFDGQNIVSTSSDFTCRVYNLQRKAEVACLRGHSNLVRALFLMPNGDIVTGGYEGCVRYWKKLAGEQWDCQSSLDMGTFQPQAGDMQSDNTDGNFRRIFDLRVSSNRLFCAGEGPIIKIWTFADSVPSGHG